MSFQFPARFGLRTPAAVLFACTAVQLIASMHHPFVRTQRTSEVVSGLAQIAVADQTFHAVLIVIAVACLYSVCAYVRQTGTTDWGLATAILFAFSTAAVTGAALIDGFFLPAYAQRAGTLQVSSQTALATIAAGSIAIQVLTKAAFVGFGLAAVFCGIELFAQKRSRINGGIIALCGCGLVAVIAVTGTITHSNLVWIALFQTIWLLCLAAYMWSWQAQYVVSEATPRA